jgi:hypothetical protein
MGLDVLLYVVFRLSALLTALAIFGVMLLTGGWEAAAAGFAILTGTAFLLSFVALLLAQDESSTPT